jgi:hypothetical protein
MIIIPKCRISAGHLLVFAIAAWTIAAICFAGVILQNDLTGRLIFGTTWILIGVWWLGRWFRANKTSSSSGSASD